jgi:peptidyl-dipeptidase Dcp
MPFAVKKLSKILLIIGLPCLIMGSCKNRIYEKSNPFFAEYNTPFDVPPFEKIHAGHYMPAFEKGMEEAGRYSESCQQQPGNGFEIP